MSRWFRMYDDVINDPKVMRLAEAMRWQWVAILCCSAKNDGKVPATVDLAFMLRMKEQSAAAIVTELVAVGLLDRDGVGFRPHNWDGRQFKSDASNERVKRYRDRKRNDECNVTSAVTETPPEQKQSRAETETDIPACRPVGRFDEFWEAYPRRDGGNPRAPAEKKFNAFVKSGVDPDVIISGVRRMAADEAAKGRVGTPYIPMAQTWLGQQRWTDHAAVVAAVSLDAPAISIEIAVAQYAKFRRWPRSAGPEPGLTGCRASAELLAAHGLRPDGGKLALAPMALPDEPLEAAE